MGRKLAFIVAGIGLGYLIFGLDLFGLRQHTPEPAEPAVIERPQSTPALSRQADPAQPVRPTASPSGGQQSVADSMTTNDPVAQMLKARYQVQMMVPGGVSPAESCAGASRSARVCPGLSSMRQG